MSHSWKTPILQDAELMQKKNLMQDHKNLHLAELFENNSAEMQKTIKIWPEL